MKSIADAVRIIYPDFSGGFDMNVDGQILNWNSPFPQPTQAEIDAAMPAIALKMQEARLTSAVQKTLDAGARLLEYDDMDSLCSYANSTDAAFRAQAIAAIAWRDAAWGYCRTVRAAVLAGAPAPTDAEFWAGFPMRPW